MRHVKLFEVVVYIHFCENHTTQVHKVINFYFMLIFVFVKHPEFSMKYSIVMEARPFLESQIKIKDSSRYLLSKIPVLQQQQSAVGSSLVGEFTLCLAMM